MNRITILLAEDHTVVREGFRRMLDFERDFELVGEAQHGRQAVAMVARLRPEVVLMDIAMPQLNGLEATRQILKRFPGTRVVMLSAHNDDAYVESAIEAGAKGFLLKQASFREICDAIRKVRDGGRFYAPRILQRLDRLKQLTPARSGATPGKTPALTSREMEVLQMIAEGRANKEMAAALSIAMKTVEKHREHLMKKLDIHDTAGLTRYAIAAGIIASSVQITIL